MDLWIDTNVIIRFLSGDHAGHSVMAKKLFALAYNGKYTLWVHNLVAAECCYVLESRQYGYDREVIATHLISLMNTRGVKPKSRDIINALELYREHNVDFEDAYLSVLSSNRKVHGIASFNIKDFQRCGCECYHPGSLITSD